MGLLDVIGGALSTVGSAITSAISGVCSAVGGFLTKAATGICNFATTLIEKGKVLFPEMSPVRIIIEVVGAAVSKIAEYLGIKKPEVDSPEDLGMKVEEAEKQPDDFESTQAYIDYLHDEINIDMEKKKNLTMEQRAAYSSIGSSLYLDASAEKLGLEKGDITPEVLLDWAFLKLEASEIIATINKLKEMGLKPQSLSDFLHNTVGAKFEEKENAMTAMMKAFMDLNPDMSQDDIADKVSDMRDEILTKEENASNN